MKNPSLNTDLKAYLDNIESEFTGIPEDRARILKQISDFIEESIASTGIAELVTICTHNSRRSQFGQIWASTAAECFGIKGIRSYSGGTEDTAFHPNAVAAVERAGFNVLNSSPNSDNPKYQVRAGEESPQITMFSKKFDDPLNPSENFCAIMVCSDADEACPHIPGAQIRISLPYEDPKKFDGTSQESLKYDERCREMARDFQYVFSLLG